MVTPVVDKGVPQVHLWYLTGEMVGTGTLTEDEARALAKALLDGIQEAKSAATAGHGGPDAV